MPFRESPFIRLREDGVEGGVTMLNNLQIAENQPKKRIVFKFRNQAICAPFCWSNEGVVRPVFLQLVGCE